MLIRERTEIAIEKIRNIPPIKEPVPPLPPMELIPIKEAVTEVNNYIYQEPYGIHYKLQWDESNCKLIVGAPRYRGEPPTCKIDPHLISAERPAFRTIKLIFQDPIECILDGQRVERAEYKLPVIDADSSLKAVNLLNNLEIPEFCNL